MWVLIKHSWNDYKISIRVLLSSEISLFQHGTVNFKLFINSNCNNYSNLFKVRVRQLEGHRQSRGKQDAGTIQRGIHPAVHLRVRRQTHLEGRASRLRRRPHPGGWQGSPLSNPDQQAATNKCFIARSCFGDYNVFVTRDFHHFILSSK